MESDWSKNDLKGRVIFLKERHYLAKMEFGRVVRCSNKLYTGIEICGSDSNLFIRDSSLVPMIKGPLGIEANEDLYFDKNGNTWREIHYNNNGIEWVSQKEYDKKNRLTNEVVSEKVERIDKELNVWCSDKSFDSIVYNENESFQFHKDENNSSKYYLWVYSKYDEKNKKIEEIRYLPSKEMGNRRVYKYDSNGRIISNVCYDSRSIIDREDTKYEGNVIIINNNGFQTIETFIDSTHKKKISEANSHGTQLWKYDDKGSVIYWQRGEGDFSYEYEYDSEGNWIKRVKYNVKFNSPEELAEREIHYYSNSGYKKNIIYFIIGSFLGGVILILIWYWKKNKK